MDLILQEKNSEKMSWAFHHQRKKETKAMEWRATGREEAQKKRKWIPIDQKGEKHS
jgi:hypothetical protein